MQIHLSFHYIVSQNFMVVTLGTYSTSDSTKIFKFLHVEKRLQISIQTLNYKIEYIPEKNFRSFILFYALAKTIPWMLWNNARQRLHVRITKYKGITGTCLCNN